jgi:DNA replication protein DnaC
MSETETRKGPCAGCGAPTEDVIEVSAATSAKVRAMLQRLPLQCASCAAAHAAETDAQDAQHAADIRQARFAERISYSGLPKSLHGPECTLEALDAPGRVEPLAAARRFASGDLAGLLLTGPFGVGKTTIAGAAAKRHMLEVGALTWLRVHEVTINLGLAFDDPIRAATIRALRTAGALVLDDLDKTRPTAHAAEPLFSAIDNAISDSRPLLVTTNLPIGQLATHWPEPFGKAIASRLVGYCEAWEITGHDRRLPQAA